MIANQMDRACWLMLPPHCNKSRLTRPVGKEMFRYKSKHQGHLFKMHSSEESRGVCGRCRRARRDCKHLLHRLQGQR